jgi:hypothetical protein
MLFHHKPARTDAELDQLAARLAAGGAGRAGGPGRPKVIMAAEGEILEL